MQKGDFRSAKKIQFQSEMDDIFFTSRDKG